MRHTCSENQRGNYVLWKFGFQRNIRQYSFYYGHLISTKYLLQSKITKSSTLKVLQGKLHVLCFDVLLGWSYQITCNYDCIFWMGLFHHNWCVACIICHCFWIFVFLRRIYRCNLMLFIYLHNIHSCPCYVSHRITDIFYFAIHICAE